MNKTTLKITAIVGATLIAATLTLGAMLSTTPKQLGPSGVTFWFIGLLIFIIGLLSIVFIIFKVYLLHTRVDNNKIINSSFRTAFLSGLVIVTFLALRSLGTLSIRDIVLLGLVLFLIEFYLRTRKKAHE